MSKGGEYEWNVAGKFGRWWKSKGVPVKGSGTAKIIPGDVVMIDPRFPFSIECKSEEDWNWWALFRGQDRLFGYWLQAKRDVEEKEPDKIPIVTLKQRYKPDLVIFKDVGEDSGGHRPPSLAERLMYELSRRDVFSFCMTICSMKAKGAEGVILHIVTLKEFLRVCDRFKSELQKGSTVPSSLP